MSKRKYQIKRKIVASCVYLFFIGIAVFLIGDLITHKVINSKIDQLKKEQKQIETSIAEMTAPVEYDELVVGTEMSLDWSGNEYSFQPIDCKLDEDVQEFAFYLCNAYDIEFSLLMAMMEVESGYRAEVISSTSDYGLMQINQINHEMLREQIGVNDFLDPEQNIRAGCYILKNLFEKHEDSGLVLMAYNMGEAGARKLWEAGIYSSEYSRKVLDAQEKIEKGMGA